MIKKIIAGICLIFSTVGFSQENNSSPYSYYGIGDTKFRGTVENRSMGGLGILADSIHLNLQNPATYSSLIFTTFTIGGSNSATKFKTSSADDSANRTTLDYLAVALPFNKIGVAFGLMPYTSVGYKIQNETVGDDGLTRRRQFNGSGGLNRVFAGASYKITPKLSVGADFQYYFGNIETKSIIAFPEVQYPTRELNTSDYSGVSFNIGAIYETKLNDKLNWHSSITYSPSTNLKSTTERQLAAITLSGNNNEIVVDELNSGTSEEDIKMPSRLSLGTGIGEARKWFAGVEYTFQVSNELGNRFNAVTSAGFEGSHKVSLGGYYIPRYMSFTSYLSRITYRAGIKYEKTGLVINNESINDVGFSFGLGLPAGGGRGGSNINLGLELGRRGTTKANLIQENYINLFVSLSLNDRWFIKRKYE